jgi:hypothetical protein
MRAGRIVAAWAEQKALLDLKVRQRLRLQRRLNLGDGAGHGE